MPTPRESRFLGIVVAAALLLGVAGRFAAIDLNRHPHGDVHLDAITLRSLAAGDGFTTPLERSVEYYRRDDGTKGYPADQHPPLALLLALALSPFEDSPYAALQRASLVASLALLVAVFLATRGAVGSGPARTVAAAFATAACAASFALADFGGNGAVYTLHALLAILAVIALGRRTAAGAFAAGVLLGLAWLTNYQALVLLPAAVLAIVVAAGREAFRRETVVRVLALGIGFAVAALPWWIRNFEVFGDPMFSVNPFYVKWKLGGEQVVDEVAGTTLLAIEWPPLGRAWRPLVANLVVNVRFIASQTPLWLGALLAFALVGMAAAWRRGRTERDARLVAIPLFLLAHLAVMVAWPACKFRYFVPLIPLVALAAAVGIARDDGDERRHGARGLGGVIVLMGLGVVFLVGVEMIVRGRAPEGLIVLAALLAGCAPFAFPAPRRAAIALAMFVAMQLVLVIASPTRTTYFDALLVGDAFKRRGAEIVDRARQEQLARIPPELAARGITAIVADVELKHHALAAGVELTVIQPPALDDPQANVRALRAALRRHSMPWILLDRADGDSVQAALTAAGVTLDVEPLATGGFLLGRIEP